MQGESLDEIAREVMRMMGSKGGKRRMAMLTAAERRELGRKAGLASGAARRKKAAQRRESAKAAGPARPKKK